MRPERLQEILGGFGRARILVVGDIILDQFLMGRVRRISPEAPVPVVEVTDETFRLGGAANVLSNLRALGVRTSLAGVIGNDPWGDEVAAMLKTLGVPSEGLIVEDGRPTSLKSRVTAYPQRQQVVRFDREVRRPPAAQTERELLAHLRQVERSFDGAIISDYGKGVVTPRLIRALLPLFGDGRKVLSVDPKVENFRAYRRVTVVTPNQFETAEAVGFDVETEADVVRAGRRVLRDLGCRAVLVTRGERGMSLVEKGGKITHIPTVAREVFDVTGAGDTVIAAFTATVVAGGTLREAAEISNHAAGIVVAKPGTAVATREEIRASFLDADRGGRKR